MADGRADSLEIADAEVARREELDEVRTRFVRGHNLGRGHSTGERDHAELNSALDDVNIRIRGDDILAAVGMGQFNQLNIRDSACAEEHLTAELLGQCTDRFGGLLP